MSEHPESVPTDFMSNYQAMVLEIDFSTDVELGESLTYLLRKLLDEAKANIETLPHEMVRLLLALVPHAAEACRRLGVEIPRF